MPRSTGNCRTNRLSSMPTLYCPCGFGHDPDDEWYTIREIDLDVVEENRPMGCLYECPQCGRVIWRKPSSEKYDVFLPADMDRRLQAMILAAASEFELEQEAVKLEAIKVHNAAAEIVASKIQCDGLRCPHCLEHSTETGFTDRNPTGFSFFQCPICSRTFRLERFKNLQTT